MALLASELSIHVVGWVLVKAMVQIRDQEGVHVCIPTWYFDVNAPFFLAGGSVFLGMGRLFERCDFLYHRCVD